MRTSSGPPAAAFRPMPRGMLGLIRADVDPKAILRDLTAGLEEFKALHKGELKNAQAAIDQMNMKLAALGMGSISSVLPSDPAYTESFGAYFRNGQGEHDLRQANASGERGRVQAAMSSGSNSDGGFLAPVEWDRTISRALTDISPLRNLCTVIETTGPGYSTVWNNGQWGSGWVGETAVRPQTTTPALAPVVFRPGEIFAMPAITQQLLDDGAINVENWLSQEVSDTFSKQESIAFVRGDGVNKPQGFMSLVGTGTTIHPGGEPGVTFSGAATAITGDALLDMVYSLGAAYRANGSWLMNSASITKVLKLKDGQGNYLWQPSFIAGQPPTLIGKPVYFEESMPDVAAGALPIAFGDWRRFYVVNDRTGTRLLRDPYSAKPYVLFYVSKRVGGGVLDPNAVRLMKVGTGP